MDAADPTEGVHGLSFDDAGNLKFDVGDVGEEDKEHIEEEGNGEDEDEDVSEDDEGGDCEHEEDKDVRLDYGSSPDEKDVLAVGTHSDFHR